LIVSNPPYFVDSLQSLDEQRTMARHNRQLTYRDLLHGASALLKPSGTFALIIPTDVASRVIDTAISLNLFPHKQTDVITAPGKLPKRCLIAFGFSQRALVKEVLLIEKERHVYSDEYIELTRNFYLKM
ncbi:tRNA (adenosine(37)-N6)-methyltransferase TrmM, partial [Bacteroides sp. OttesenSCG-928-E20]|nr:tRNA (adenosine(37)-N6)-methyltransferase TrmM [Bacteroides sp. OttesenSCG-928-E20]